MKRSSIFILQAAVVVLGLAVLAFLLGEPHLEGRNAHATPFEVYFKDPLLAYVYLASVPFFVALYQAFKVLGYAGQNQAFSPAAVHALRTIKYCAIAMIGFTLFSFVFVAFAEGDDGPPGVMMRLLVIFPTIVVAAAAAMFERVLQNAVDIKSENDFTV
ncbi:DUF2975 domain-containing protein [Lacipirellula sp.]|uniref:DUF2975 domain-containing protein n=1 Tax=Lacipirellula sp. TaxID=2691419 RepID=UPI003D0A864A